jgi:hypothetical protein
MRHCYNIIQTHLQLAPSSSVQLCALCQQQAPVAPNHTQGVALLPAQQNALQRCCCGCRLCPWLLLVVLLLRV